MFDQDVRPSNMGYTMNNGGTSLLDGVVLFDWASSCDLGSRPMFSGTLHYAANDVLETLAGYGDPLSMANYDLESLVKSFWDITRGALERPRAVMIESADRPVQQVAQAILTAWQTEEQTCQLLRRLLVLARNGQYDSLRAEFENFHE